jgi:hypothetical protein
MLEPLKELIKKYFFFDERFYLWEKLIEGDSKEFDFIDSIDKRKFYEIKKEDYEFIDEGYSLVKSFHSFFDEKGEITYNDYKENKIGGVSIFKELLNFYYPFLEERIGENARATYYYIEDSAISRTPYNDLFLLMNKCYLPSERRNFDQEIAMNDGLNAEDLTRAIIQKIFNKIGSYKLPKNAENLSFVISRNFNDFFLCSCGNSWTSCLSPYSKSGLWSSLPFSMIDKNRAICYITDGRKKSYREIESYNMIKRSWGMLDYSGVLRMEKSYPSKEFFNERLFESLGIYGLVSNISENYYSKYPIPFLFNKYEIFDFIYQDHTQLCFGTDGIYMKYGEHRHELVTNFKNKGLSIRKINFFGNFEITLEDRINQYGYEIAINPKIKEELH